MRSIGVVITHMSPSSICDEQNIRLDSDLRELLRTLLCLLSFVNNSDSGFGWLITMEK